MEEAKEVNKPYGLGSGLYQSSKLADPTDGNLDLDDKYCELTEVGIWIYHVLNGIPVPKVVDSQSLF